MKDLSSVINNFQIFSGAPTGERLDYTGFTLSLGNTSSLGSFLQNFLL